MQEGIAHTVIFTWKPTASVAQKARVITRLNEMGQWLIENLGVTDWALEGHIRETNKAGRADLIQHCVFPSREALDKHGASDVHHRVVELTRVACDWRTIDWVVPNPTRH